MTAMLDWTAVYHTHCHDLAAEAFRRYCKSISPVLYLYGYKAHGSYDRLVLAAEQPDGAELVIPVYVPRHYTVEALTRWFIHQLRREPVLPAMGL